MSRRLGRGRVGFPSTDRAAAFSRSGSELAGRRRDRMCSIPQLCSDATKTAARAGQCDSLAGFEWDVAGCWIYPKPTVDLCAPNRVGSIQSWPDCCARRGPSSSARSGASDAAKHDRVLGSTWGRHLNTPTAATGASFSNRGRSQRPARNVADPASAVRSCQAVSITCVETRARTPSTSEGSTGPISANADTLWRNRSCNVRADLAGDHARTS